MKLAKSDRVSENLRATANAKLTFGVFAAVVVSVGVAASCSKDSGGDTNSSGGQGGSAGQPQGGAGGAEDADSTSGGGSGGVASSGESSSGGSSSGGSSSGGTSNGTTSVSTGGVGGDSGGSHSGAGSAGEAGTGDGGTGGDTEVDPPDGPHLLDLEIEGVRVPLQPEFSAHRARYSVIPNDAADDLVITAVAPPEFEISIQDIDTESGEPLTLNANEVGSELSIVVSDAEGASRSYTVLYLPADFPEITVTVNDPAASTDPIYFTPYYPETTYIVKVDNEGVPLFYLGSPSPRGAFDFKKHPNGQYSFAQEATRSLADAEQVVLDEDFEEVARVRTVGGLQDTDIHEFLILPNGNYMAMAYYSAERDATEYGLAVDQRLTDGVLQEITPGGELVFEWNSWDHMTLGENAGGLSQNDYAHLNSVVVDDDGNWLVSSRMMAQVFKIDRSTGEVMWRLGGISNDFTFLNDPFGSFCGQHTASRLENGNILIFDNGQPCVPEVPERGELTRVVEYKLDMDEMTAELVWSYEREDGISRTEGSAQRLSNGNTFIGWGAAGGKIASEVEPDGRIVFEMSARSPFGEVKSYRARRFAD